MTYERVRIQVGDDRVVHAAPEFLVYYGDLGLEGSAAGVWVRDLRQGAGMPVPLEKMSWPVGAIVAFENVGLRWTVNSGNALGGTLTLQVVNPNGVWTRLWHVCDGLLSCEQSMWVINPSPHPASDADNPRMYRAYVAEMDEDRLVVYGEPGGEPVPYSFWAAAGKTDELTQARHLQVRAPKGYANVMLRWHVIDGPLVRVGDDELVLRGKPDFVVFRYGADVMVCNRATMHVKSLSDTVWPNNAVVEFQSGLVPRWTTVDGKVQLCVMNGANRFKVWDLTVPEGKTPGMFVYVPQDRVASAVEAEPGLHGMGKFGAGGAVTIRNTVTDTPMPYIDWTRAHDTVAYFSVTEKPGLAASCFRALSRLSQQQADPGLFKMRVGKDTPFPDSKAHVNFHVTMLDLAGDGDFVAYVIGLQSMSISPLIGFSWPPNAIVEFEAGLVPTWYMVDPDTAPSSHVHLRSILGSDLGPLWHTRVPEDHEVTYLRFKNGELTVYALDMETTLTDLSNTMGICPIGRAYIEPFKDYPRDGIILVRESLMGPAVPLKEWLSARGGNGCLRFCAPVDQAQLLLAGWRREEAARKANATTYRQVMARSQRDALELSHTPPGVPDVFNRLLLNTPAPIPPGYKFIDIGNGALLANAEVSCRPIRARFDPANKSIAVRGGVMEGDSIRPKWPTFIQSLTEWQATRPSFGILAVPQDVEIYPQTSSAILYKWNDFPSVLLGPLTSLSPGARRSRSGLDDIVGMLVEDLRETIDQEVMAEIIGGSTGETTAPLGPPGVQVSVSYEHDEAVPASVVPPKPPVHIECEVVIVKPRDASEPDGNGRVYSSGCWERATGGSLHGCVEYPSGELVAREVPDWLLTSEGSDWYLAAISDAAIDALGGGRSRAPLSEVQHLKYGDTVELPRGFMVNPSNDADPDLVTVGFGPSHESRLLLWERPHRVITYGSVGFVEEQWSNAPDWELIFAPAENARFAAFAAISASARREADRVPAAFIVDGKCAVGTSYASAVLRDGDIVALPRGVHALFSHAGSKDEHGTRTQTTVSVHGGPFGDEHLELWTTVVESVRIGEHPIAPAAPAAVAVVKAPENKLVSMLGLIAAVAAAEAVIVYHTPWRRLLRAVMKLNPFRLRHAHRKALPLPQVPHDSALRIFGGLYKDSSR